MISFQPKQRKLFVGNLGDARAVLCKRGSVKALTQDHLPSAIGEGTRIKGAGGEIVDGKVMSVCNVSRAFGSKTLKKKEGILIAQPFVHEYIIHQVLAACDSSDLHLVCTHPHVFISMQMLICFFKFLARLRQPSTNIPLLEQFISCTQCCYNWAPVLVDVGVRFFFHGVKPPGRQPAVHRLVWVLMRELELRRLGSGEG